MPAVVLLISDDCPNVPDARNNLKIALEQSGLPASWQEFDLDNPETPAEFRSHGSPTILVDGVDVAGVEANASSCCSCRVYTAADGRMAGVPPIDMITAKLRTDAANAA